MCWWLLAAYRWVTKREKRKGRELCWCVNSRSALTTHPKRVVFHLVTWNHGKKKNIRPLSSATHALLSSHTPFCIHFTVWPLRYMCRIATLKRTGLKPPSAWEEYCKDWRVSNLRRLETGRNLLSSNIQTLKSKCCSIPFPQLIAQTTASSYWSVR